MKTIKNEEIKARIDGATKTALWAAATERQLDVSDLIREAIRDFLNKNKQAKAA